MWLTGMSLLIVVISFDVSSGNVTPPPRRLIVDGTRISEPESPSAPMLLRGFNLDFK